MKSLRWYEYYVTFISDFSRKTQIYFSKNKDGIFGCFQELKALMENAIDRRLKFL